MAILGGDMLECDDYDYERGYKIASKKMLDVLDTVVWYNDLGEVVLEWKLYNFNRKPINFNSLDECLQVSPPKRYIRL